MRKARVLIALALVAGVGVAVTWLLAADREGQVEARRLLETSGVKGGLVVDLGCGQGRLLAALHASSSYLVQGLDRSAEKVARARDYVRRRGPYGQISVDRLVGKSLPYIENLVNLLVVEDPSGISEEEMMRVVAPLGVLYIKRGGRWEKKVKPWPKGLDEWTHYLHDATGNVVSHDSVVGPPRRLQWVGSPRWSRHHDRMASMSALVSAHGRIFYIFDEAPQASVMWPSRWSLIARDAFSGVILWKRHIAQWHPQLYPFKSGPAYLPRRLVAVGDRVYVTLGLNAPLSELDAATGKTLRTWENTRATEEVLASRGVVFAVVNPHPRDWSQFQPQSNNVGREKIRVAKEYPWDRKPRELTALDPKSGKVLWVYEAPVVPLSLAVDDRHVVFHDGEKVICLDRNTGKEVWHSHPIGCRHPIPTNFGPTLVLYRDLVLFAGGDRHEEALSASTGKVLWSADHPRSGHNSPQDLIVMDGLVWAGQIAGSKDVGTFYGRDPYTGELKEQFNPDVQTYWFHHRCYRSKATDRYIMPSRTGIEFVDPQTRHWQINHWVRGGCIYGVMPCNGLVYAPMHDCACYPEAKLYGFNALAPAGHKPPPPEKIDATARLERGPAYGKAGGFGGGSGDDWPTYRHDEARSGHTTARVSPQVKQQWERELGGRLTSPVVADGHVWVASRDVHTVYCLDAATGDPVWTYVAGGRVDTPPTVWHGQVYFGSADGWVYCLRERDGQLAWRFRAAPEDRRLVAFEQVESVWPVHGSVLIHDGALYCVAGRSMFLDGGLRLLKLDPATGHKLLEVVLDDRDPQTGKSLQDRIMGLNMPVALADILSTDGRHLFMKSQRFTFDGVRQDLGPYSGSGAEQARHQSGEGAHIFAPFGFVDDSWFHRSYWVYGKVCAGGAGGYYQAGRFAPAGRLLVHDAQWVYGFARQPQYFRWTTSMEYHLFSASTKIPEAKLAETGAGVCYVGVSKSARLNPAGKALAVEAWVKADRGSGVILARGGNVHGYALFLQQGRPQFAVRIKESVSAVGGKRKVVGRWVHLAGVLDQDKTLRLYVNGKLVDQAKARGLIAANPAQALEVGADLGSAVGDYKSPFGFSGLVDQVRVYYRALSSQEVAQHFAQPSSVPTEDPTLMLCLSFDDGKARDESSQGNRVQLHGAQPVAGKVAQALKFTNKTTGKMPFFVEFRWSQEIPMLVRAMVLAGDTLFLAGPPDLVNEEEALARPDDAAIQAALQAQEDAWLGRKGALLWAVGAADGHKLFATELASPPLFDGMAAADGRLFLATMDGKLHCFGGR